MYILRLPADICIARSFEVCVNDLIIMRLVKGFVTGVGLYYYLLQPSMACVVSFSEVFSTRCRQESGIVVVTGQLYPVED